MERTTSPSLPTIPTPLTPQEKRVMKDKGQKRSGKKRVAILLHPKIKAFKDWKHEPEPWSYRTIAKYVDWCHISKLFMLCRHPLHVQNQKVNLAYATDARFMCRCCEVWTLLYLETKVYRNNSFSFFLLRMVYAEVVLKKIVDWTTLLEMPIAVCPDKKEWEDASSMWAKDLLDISKMMTSIKHGASFVADEEVVWSSTSSSNEHIHEYNRYSFSSDDEDVFVTKSKKSLDVGLHKKKERGKEPITSNP